MQCTAQLRVSNHSALHRHRFWLMLMQIHPLDECTHLRPKKLPKLTIDKFLRTVHILRQPNLGVFMCYGLIFCFDLTQWKYVGLVKPYKRQGHPLISSTRSSLRHDAPSQILQQKEPKNCGQHVGKWPFWPYFHFCRLTNPNNSETSRPDLFAQVELCLWYCYAFCRQAFAQAEILSLYLQAGICTR